jgi:ATP-dependent Clp protease ATP-binding subunit ClpC
MDRDEILGDESRIENLGVNMASWGGGKESLHPRMGPVRLLARSLEQDGIQPILLGEAGVGKKSTVATLARGMADGDILVCPSRLHRMKIIRSTPSDIFTGALYVGQIEDKVKRVVRNCVKMDAVLFLDNLPSFMGKGSSACDPDGDILTLLTPFLRHGKFRVVCTATPDGWAQVCRRNPAFARLLTPLHVPEATRDETEAVLAARASGWREKYAVEFGPGTFEDLIDLADRLYPWKRNPGKACDLMEETLALFGAAAAMANDGGEEVYRLGRADVAELVRSFTRLPGFLLDPSKPASREMLRNHFRARLFGQDEVVETLVDRIQMIKAGLCEPGRPLAAYLLAGPTGVGKTLAARTLANLLLGDEKRLVRFDMSEFGSHESVSRLIGGEGGMMRRRGGLVDAALTETFPVILLDEIEKAHWRVFDVLLQVLGEGRLTDESGRTANLGNAVILMTTNLGSSRRSIIHPRPPAGDADRAALVDEAVRQHFRPEFINRLTGILVFNPLGRKEAEIVARKEVERLAERRGLKSRAIRLEVAPEVFERIVEAGYSKEYGARPMERAVESFVGVPLARHMAERPQAGGVTLVVGGDREGAKPVAVEKKDGAGEAADFETETEEAAALAILQRRASARRDARLRAVKEPSNA